MGFTTYGDKNNLKLIIAFAKLFLTAGRIRDTKIYKSGSSEGIYISCEFCGDISEEDFESIMGKVEIKGIDIEEKIIKLKEA